MSARGAAHPSRPERSRPGARAVGAALAVALVCTFPARAHGGEAAAPERTGETEPDARAAGALRMAEGVRAFHAGEFEEATVELAVAETLLPSGHARAEARLFLGLAEAVLGRWPQARAAFEAALTDDPELAPDPARVRPAICEAFAEVRRRMSGGLRVASDRPASVRIDGIAMGRTPLDVELSIGRHTIRLDSDDRFAALELDGVLVRTATVARVDAVLVPRFGLLSVGSEPPGAAVVEDGRTLATTPARGLRLTAGPHHLTFELSGHERAMAEAVVDPDRPGELSIALLPRDGRTLLERPRIYAVLAGGAAIALAVVGGFFGVSARAAESELHARAAEGTLDFTRLSALDRDAHDGARTANLLYATAGAATAIAVLLLLVD